MNRHEFLRGLHEKLQPRTYLEIGVNDGRSLTLSRAKTVAVDPAPKVTSEIHCDVQLVRATSDDLFARPRPLEHLDDRIDLAFIDGMHLLEYALRDFVNVERYSDWSSVIVLDDQLPRNVDEAARDRHTLEWTGDVYKMIPILQRHRPDLRVVAVDTKPTGVAVIFGADSSSTVLRDGYDSIVADYLVADPQPIPDEILTRACAVDPRVLLDAPLWGSLVAGREDDARGYGREQLLGDVDAATGETKPRLGEWVPDAALRRVPEAPPTVGEEALVRLRQRRAATRRRTDVFSRVAGVVPAVKRIPGARAVVRIFR